MVQVNLCQKLLFLHQLTHNITIDCSWNYHKNYKCRTLAEHVLPMFCACSFYGNSMNNLLSYCGLVDARISASEKDLPVPQFHGMLVMVGCEFDMGFQIFSCQIRKLALQVIFLWQNKCDDIWCRIYLLVNIWLCIILICFSFYRGHYSSLPYGFPQHCDWDSASGVRCNAFIRYLHKNQT